MTEEFDLELLGRIAATIDSLERHDLLLVIDKRVVLLNLWAEVMANILGLPEGFSEAGQAKLNATVVEFLRVWDAQKAEEK